MGRLGVFFELNYEEATPIEWQDIDITATFDDQVQPVLITDEFTFVNNDATRILNWFITSPFEGMPFSMALEDGQRSYIVNGCLDFEDFTISNESEVKVKIKIDDGIDLLDERIKAVSYGYLCSINLITKNDYVEVPTIIRKKFDAVEVAMTSLSLYLVSKELTEFFLNGKKTIADIAVVGLEDPTSKPSAILRVVLMKLVYIAYYAIILLAIYRMIRTIQDNLYPSATKYKGMFERKLLEKACQHFGLTLDCNIPEIDWTVYLPSKTDNRIRKNQKDEGIPNPSDFGYNLSELFELILKKYNAKTKKIGDTLYIRTENDPFWFETSSYTLPDILFDGQTVRETKFVYNTFDLKANRIISYQYDFSDEWTMPNARATPFDSKEKDFEKRQHEKGVAHEVLTDLRVTQNFRYKLIKGLEEIRIPQALAARKTTLTALEIGAIVLLSTVDIVIKLFGGKTFSSKINEHRGFLLLSSPSFNVCKAVVLQGGTIPANHRTLNSASKLYNQYYYNRSFDYINNPNNNSQRKIYKEIKIPFNFEDFTKCIDNSYFTTADGKQGKFTSLKWKIDKDYAIADFWIAEEYLQKEVIFETQIET